MNNVVWGKCAGGVCQHIVKDGGTLCNPVPIADHRLDFWSFGKRGVRWPNRRMCCVCMNVLVRRSTVDSDSPVWDVIEAMYTRTKIRLVS